ncbi:MAG: MiaB/RimO family radical SAM methylthiotransferase [Candidatus Roizmanbacteria bacterium]
MKTFYSYSFGCRVNEAEKEEIDRKMASNGFKFDINKPDIFIINSCSVTNKAERETRQFIYKTKKNLPKSYIVVTGCAATFWMKNKLYQDLPIDLMVDNINKEFLVKLIKKRLSYQPDLNRVGWNRMAGTSKFLDSGRLMVKIQDGCQRFCSFCIVPYLRGIPKSERIKNLVCQLADKNYDGKIKEVILTAINTQAYGYDTGESFIDLIENIINKTRIPRISFGSIHPWTINDDFFRFYKKILPKKRLVNFFHIPLQSGSNKMLNLMKRGYTREEMLEKLQSLKSFNELALIATDIIVGFLEETDRDFEDTYNFLKKSPISKFHIFRFSKRSKTAADYMAKKLKEPIASVKIKRAKALSELGLKKYYKFLQKNVGRTSSVLFLQKSIDGFREGLLDNQLPIYIAAKGRSATSEVAEAGAIKTVKILEFKKGKLFGKLI